MKLNKPLIYILIATAILIIVLVIGKKQGWFGKEIEIKVAVEKPQNRSIIETITANGKIQPETEVKITPDVPGEIVELNVKEGEFVEKGKLLLKIKPDTYISARDRAAAAVNSANARLAQAKAQFMKAELDYKRSKILWEQKTISDAEFEQAESQFKIAAAEVEAAEYSVKSAEAALNEAEENLIKTLIYAPMSGTVSKLSVEFGERVAGTSMMAGTELLRIADLSRMEVNVEVNENDIIKVSLYDTAIIEVDAYMEYKFKGIVTEIANSANTTGVSVDQVTNFEVKILLLQDSYQELVDKGNKNPFRPGMSATADIRTEYRENALSIPIQAVTVRSDSLLLKIDTTETTEPDSDNEMQEVIFIVKEGKAKIRKIETGIQDDNYIEVIAGVDTLDEVIKAPYSVITKKLENDTKVLVVIEEELFK